MERVSPTIILETWHVGDSLDGLPPDVADAIRERLALAEFLQELYRDW